MYFCRQNRKIMDISIHELMKPGRQQGNVPYMLYQGSQFLNYRQVSLDKGFFFILVTNGSAQLSDIHQEYVICQDNLIIQTPSIASKLANISPDFSAFCLYVLPEYFDSLPAGQLAYNQVSLYTGNYQTPIFLLNTTESHVLQKTLSLFSGQIEAMNLYRDGIIRHLCSLLLLQVADVLYKKSQHTNVYLKRSNEIFRNFKRLLVHHYREHHDIGFYANQLSISTTYLSRIVKNKTGRTVRFHISELLCADARKLLESTDLDIKAIADMLGFSDQSVFGKFFLRKTGRPPIKFRTKKEH